MKQLLWLLCPLLELQSGIAAELWSRDLRVLSCHPTLISPGDELILKLGKKHGQELSIERMADQTSYVLVVGSPPDGVYQLLTTKQLRSTSQVKINTALQATPWSNGKTGVEPVFTQPGTYRIRLSENLESEYGGHYCDVQFRKAAQ